MTNDSPLYLGFDLSTQQFKGIAVTSSLKVEHEVKFDFDADSKGFNINKGVLTNEAENEVFSPVTMWLQAIDGVLRSFRDAGMDFDRVRGISGAGMQHGSVYWNSKGEQALESLDVSRSLEDQLADAFAHPYSPNWQDASTQEQCDVFDAQLGDATQLALLTGSKAHHLWDIKAGAWNESLLSLVAGSNDTSDLKQKLGAAEVPEDGGAFLGNISPYFVQRYGFHPACAIAPSTGDNPSTILALPLRPSDVIVSLGTSTTLLMSTPYFKPNRFVHFMNHPTTPGLHMFMLCYKNGGLAREQVRDSLPPSSDATNPWQQFDLAASEASTLGQSSDLSSPIKIGLFFPRPEIVPNVRAGIWRFIYKPSTCSLMEADETTWKQPKDDARAIVESQFLSLRLRSGDLLESPTGPNAHLPPQPRRVYLVGGASQNATIAKIAGQVLGGWEGVYRLDVGENACALGAAYKAVWSVERKEKQSFEELVGGRWKEDEFVKKIADGYQEGIFEKYGRAVDGLDLIERQVLKGEEKK